jgi:hypothetical protein
MQLPVIVESNAWTLPQERFNAEWVRENGVGIVLENFRHIDRTICDLLSTKRLNSMRRAIACVENHAVYEVPRVLAQILADHKIGLRH